MAALLVLPAAASAAAQPADTVIATAGRPPLPRLGVRVSAGRDFANGSAVYPEIQPKLWLGVEANRWLFRRLSVGVATIALVPTGSYRTYNYAVFAQGHLTVTLLTDPPFSLNGRVGIAATILRAKRTRECDFMCSDILPRTEVLPGTVVGLYPTFRLTDQWSVDGTVEVRTPVDTRYVLGLLGVGVKRRFGERSR